MAPPRCSGLLAIRPTGRPSMRASAVWMPCQSRCAVPAAALRPPAVPWRRACRTRAGGSRAPRAQQALVGRIQSRVRPWKNDRYCARRPPLRPRLHQHVDHAIGVLHGAGPICSGLEHAQAAAFDHGRAAHADVAARVAMITSLQPSSAALPAKQRPLTMPTTGTWPDSARSWRRCARAGRPRWACPHRPGGRRRLRRTAPRAASACSAMPSMRSVLAWLRMPCVPASTVAS
jgi:hypothetical protein